MAKRENDFQKDLRYNKLLKGYILDIASQGLRELPLNIMDLDCLDEIVSIRARENHHLTSIPSRFDFSRLTQLKILDMSSCALTEFVVAFCDLHKLRKLILSKNKLISFPDSLASLHSLQSLTLINCELENVPACISTLPALEELDLEGNKLHQIPTTFKKLYSLLMLDLSHNQFTAFPKVVFAMPSLVDLRVEQNQISDQDDELIKTIQGKQDFTVIGLMAQH